MGNDLGRIDPRELDRFITRDDDDRAECPDCEGTGEQRVYEGISSSNRTYPCPRCDGSGSIGKL